MKQTPQRPRIQRRLVKENGIKYDYDNDYDYHHLHHPTHRSPDHRWCAGRDGSETTLYHHYHHHYQYYYYYHYHCGVCV